MDIVLTGTGSPLPAANRAGPSTLVKAGDTHLHSDNVCALNDVITTHWIMTQGNGTLPNRSGSPEQPNKHFDGEIVIGDDLTTITI